MAPIVSISSFLPTGPDWPNFSCANNGPTVSYMTTASNSDYSALAVLSDTQVMAVGTLDAANGVKAKILTLSGTNITVESETSITNSILRSVALAPIDSTRAIIIYIKNPLDYAMRILSVSGTTITEGAEFIVPNTSTTSEVLDISIIDSTRALIIYRDNSSFLSARVISFSGTTITSANSSIVVHAQTTLFSPRIERLDTNRFGVALSSNGADTTMFLLDISGTVVSLASATSVDTAATVNGPARIAAFSPTSFLIAYEPNTTNLVAVKAGSISGSTITFGTEITVALADQSIGMDFFTIAGTSQAVMVGKNSSSNEHRVRILTVNGLNVTDETFCDFTPQITTPGNHINAIRGEQIDASRSIFISRRTDTSSNVLSATILSA